MKKITFLLLAFAFMLTFFGCNKANDKLLTPAGGLGDTIDNINASHGQPVKIMTPINAQGYGKNYIYNNIIVGSYIDNRARDINFKPEPGEKWTESQAMTEVKKYIPKDASLVKSQDKNDLTKINFYKSDSLSKYFKDNYYEDNFGKVERGSFIVVLQHDQQGVFWVLVSTGQRI